MTTAGDTEALLPTDALETLHQVNAYLRAALIRLQPERTHCSTIQPRDFSDLRHQIRRAAECLRRLPPHAKAIAPFEKEFSEYRSHLAKLSHTLPDLYGRLMAEKSRLEIAKTSAAATAAWAAASETTL
jgi:hypothetical protein